MLLFYLRGEIQKLGDAHLNDEKRAAFDNIFSRMRQAILLVGKDKADAAGSEEADAAGAERAGAGFEAAAPDGMCAGRAAVLLRQVYRELAEQADGLGIYGEAVRYLAEEWRRTLVH